jgi:hypothetical protein
VRRGAWGSQAGWTGSRGRLQDGGQVQAGASTMVTNGSTFVQCVGKMGEWQVHRAPIAGGTAQPAGGSANHRSTAARPACAAMCSHIARSAGAPAACDAASSSSTMPWRSCMVGRIRPRRCCPTADAQQLFPGAGWLCTRLSYGNVRDRGRRAVKQGLDRRATLDKRRAFRAQPGGKGGH